MSDEQKPWEAMESRERDEWLAVNLAKWERVKLSNGEAWYDPERDDLAGREVPHFTSDYAAALSLLPAVYSRDPAWRRRWKLEFAFLTGGGGYQADALYEFRKDPSLIGYAAYLALSGDPS